MGVAEAMATFVADKCKAGNCAGCTHPRCTHECHKIEAANNGEGAEAPTAEAMPDATAPSGEVQGQNNPADAGVEPTPNGEGPGSIAEITAVATSAAPAPGVTDGGDSEGGHGSHVASEAPVGAHFDELPIDWIVPAPDNVRQDLGDLSGLVESIKANGILEPLVVVPCPDGDDEHRYHLVAGERRWTAAREAGLREVPAMVRDAVSEDVRVELMLIENLQRKDLDPLEEADGYRRLTEFGLSQRKIASRVGCTQAHISHRMALLDLAPKVREAIATNKITVTEARELGKLDDHKRQEAALKEAKKSRTCGGEPGVEWAVEEQLREAKAAEKKAAIEAEAQKKGWSLLERNERDYGPDKGFKRIVKESWESGLHLDVKAHRKEPCHALLIDGRAYDGPKKVEVCTAPTRHAPKGESELKEPAPEKRPVNEHKKRQREEQKAKKAVGARRMEFLADRLAKKIARDKAVEIVCEALVHRAEHEAKKQAVAMLGLEGDVREAIDQAAAKGPEGLLKVALALALGTGDASARATWMGWDSAPVQWLYRFLVDEGYELDEFETGQMHAKELREEQAASNRLKLLARLEQTGLPLEVRQVLDQKIRNARSDDLEAFLLESAEDPKA
jgi:ParB/RepB/Spo0J family partition protein